MAPSLEELTIDASVVREAHDIALKSVGMGYPGRMPRIETLIEKSGISPKKQETHRVQRQYFWELDPLVAFLHDFSYLHEARVHSGRLRHSSKHPYINHTADAGAQLFTHTPDVHHARGIRDLAILGISVNRHDGTEERSDDEVARREDAGEHVTREQRARIRREKLADQHQAYLTAIDVFAQRFGLSEQQVAQLQEIERDNLIIEDKLSRGRTRRRREVDTYDQYWDKSIAGQTQIFGNKSDVRHELLAEIVKCYETGQNGNTLFPDTEYLKKHGSDLPQEIKGLFDEIMYALEPGRVVWDKQGPEYQPGPLGQTRQHLIELYRNGEQERLEQELAVYEQREKRYEDVLEDYLYIIPPHSRADTIQWNAYMANGTFKSVRTARNNRDRFDLVSQWHTEAAHSAATWLSERTFIHASREMDNHIVYNQFPIEQAIDIYEGVLEFQDYQHSFKITSEQDAETLPDHLKRYDQFTDWLYKMASGDEDAKRRFKEDIGLQFQQMSVARELSWRLLDNAYMPPQLVQYARGSISANEDR